MMKRCLCLFPLVKAYVLLEFGLHTNFSRRHSGKESVARASTLPAAVINIPPLLPSRSIGIGVDIYERSVIRSPFTNLISNNSSRTPPILSADPA